MLTALERGSKITIKIDNFNLNLKIIKSKKIKSNIYFKIKTLQNLPYLEVKTPYSITKKETMYILNQNISSIKRLYLKYQNDFQKRFAIERDDEILFLGKALSIKEIDSNCQKNKKEIRESFYKIQAPKVLLPLIHLWQDRMRLYANKISFRKAKRQWGSCSIKDNISLNIYLCMLPKELIEYVIVHELAHIKHKNHSKEFWEFVGRYYPDYKNAKKELKSFARVLES